MTLNEQRARLLRILIGAIMMSSEDRSEIQEFCSLLSTDSQIGLDMATTLRTMLSIDDEESHIKKFNADLKPPSIPVEMFFTSLRKYEISKRECLDMMRKANPRFIEPRGFEKMATKDLVRRFFSQSSSGEVAKLLSLIQPEEMDPYLQKIGKNR